MRLLFLVVDWRNIVEDQHTYTHLDYTLETNLRLDCSYQEDNQEDNNLYSGNKKFAILNVAFTQITGLPHHY